MIAAALRELMAAGVTGDALIAAIERIEATMYRRSPGAKRQARYRTNHPSQSVTSDACDDPSPPSFSPSTPTPITTPPSSSLRSESTESDWPKGYFAQFWAVYPRKVGKKAAARRLDSVRRAGEIGWAALLAAIERIERKDPQFIPHPSTWLNEGRYLDGIATGPPPDDTPKGWRPGLPTHEELKRKYAQDGPATPIEGGEVLEGGGGPHRSEQIGGGDKPRNGRMVQLGKVFSTHRILSGDDDAGESGGDEARPVHGPGPVA